MNEKDNKNLKTSQGNKMSFSYARNFYPTSFDTKNMFIAKKAHKIMTAIFMLTELLPEEETLRKSLRDKSNALTSQLFEALSAPVQNRGELLSKGQNILEQILCLLETMHYLAYASEMNLQILVNECHKLQDKLSEYFRQTLIAQKRFTVNAGRKEFAIEEDFFGGEDISVIRKTDPSDIFRGQVMSDSKHTQSLVPEMKSLPARSLDSTSPRQTWLRSARDDRRESLGETQKAAINPINKGHEIKDISKGQETIKRTEDKGQILGKKDNRHDMIIDVLLRKGNVSIPAICAELPGYSSKTIQRDLNTLINKGLVLRKGDRRWSTYSLFVG